MHNVCLLREHILETMHSVLILGGVLNYFRGSAIFAHSVLCDIMISV